MTLQMANTCCFLYKKIHVKIWANPTRPVTRLIQTCFNPPKMTRFDMQFDWPNLFWPDWPAILPCLNLLQWAVLTAVAFNSPNPLTIAYWYFILIVRCYLPTKTKKGLIIFMHPTLVLFILERKKKNKSFLVRLFF